MCFVYLNKILAALSRKCKETVRKIYFCTVSFFCAPLVFIYRSLIGHNVACRLFGIIVFAIVCVKLSNLFNPQGIDRVEQCCFAGRIHAEDKSDEHRHDKSACDGHQATIVFQPATPEMTWAPMLPKKMGGGIAIQCGKNSTETRLRKKPISYFFRFPLTRLRINILFPVSIHDQHFFLCVFFPQIYVASSLSSFSLGLFGLCLLEKNFSVNHT